MGCPHLKKKNKIKNKNNLIAGCKKTKKKYF